MEDNKTLAAIELVAARMKRTGKDAETCAAELCMIVNPLSRKAITDAGKRLASK